MLWKGNTIVAAGQTEQALECYLRKKQASNLRKALKEGYSITYEGLDITDQYL